MRKLLLYVVLILTIAVVAYILISPTFLGDYRWVMLALPISLLIIKEIYDSALMSGPSRLKKRFLKYILETDEEEKTEWDEDEPLDMDARALTGFWAGTARIWPAKPEDNLQILPLYLMFSSRPMTSCSILSRAGNSQSTIVSAEVIEFDNTTGNLDLQLVLAEGRSQRTLDAKLLLKPGVIVSEDQADAVTVELKKARLKPVAVRDN